MSVSYTHLSNYARLLSKRKGNPKILKTVFQKGYQRVTLPQAMYGKQEKHMYYLHKLVAEAFCDIQSWVKPGDTIEVHHISRILSLIHIYHSRFF